MNETKYFHTFSKDVSLEMKGIAVVLMLIHHLFSCFPDLMEEYQVSTAPLSYVRLMELSTQSKVCVGMFVFLSAYGMTVSMSSKDQHERTAYVKRRYLKLISGFLVVYAAAFLAALCIGNRINLYFEEGIGKGLLYIVFDAFGIANIMGSPTLNETWWYMSVAVLLIFLLPILLRLYEKFGVCMLAVIFMASYLGMPETVFTEYLFVCVTGIWAAKSSSAEKIFNYPIRHGRSRKVVAACLAGNTVILAVLMYIRMKWGYTYWIDATVAFGTALELFLITDACGIQLRIMKILGRYSMNIFLIHTLIFEYYFTGIIYSFRNWLLITAALLILSLAVSVILERIQRIVTNLVLQKYSSIEITY